MAITLTVNGVPYSFPSQGENPPNGEVVANWALAVTNLLATLSNASDINTTSFTVANNTSSATNVTGLSFSTTTVRSAIIQYNVYRNSSNFEAGEMHVIYDGSDWDISIYKTGDAGVNFSITSAGQVQYVSSNAAAGTMKFSAKTFTQ